MIKTIAQILMQEYKVIEVVAYEYDHPLDSSIKLIVHRKHDRDGNRRTGWMVTDKRTGRAISGKDPSRKKAIARCTKLLKSMAVESYRSAMFRYDPIKTIKMKKLYGGEIN